jgi:hypothetical protein
MKKKLGAEYYELSKEVTEPYPGPPIVRLRGSGGR